MLDLFIIKHEDQNQSTIGTKIDVFTDEIFALGALSELMSADEIQVKSVINVVDGTSIEVSKPVFKDGKLSFECDYNGSIGEVEEGVYVMVYIEDDNYETSAFEEESEMKQAFAENQRTPGRHFLSMFKVDIDAAVLMPIEIEIENFKYQFKPDLKKKGAK